MSSRIGFPDVTARSSYKYERFDMDSWDRITTKLSFKFEIELFDLKLAVEINHTVKGRENVIAANPGDPVRVILILFLLWFVLILDTNVCVIFSKFEKVGKATCFVICFDWCNIIFFY